MHHWTVTLLKEGGSANRVVQLLVRQRKLFDENGLTQLLGQMHLFCLERRLEDEVVEGRDGLWGVNGHLDMFRCDNVESRAMQTERGFSTARKMRDACFSSCSLLGLGVGAASSVAIRRSRSSMLQLRAEGLHAMILVKET